MNNNDTLMMKLSERWAGNAEKHKAYALDVTLRHKKRINNKWLPYATANRLANRSRLPEIISPLSMQNQTRTEAIF